VSKAIEVITSIERHRRWSAAEKERLVAASLEVGASVFRGGAGGRDPPEPAVSLFPIGRSSFRKARAASRSAIPRASLSL
jgi:hypothetical protein